MLKRQAGEYLKQECLYLRIAKSATKEDLFGKRKKQKTKNEISFVCVSAKQNKNWFLILFRTESTHTQKYVQKNDIGNKRNHAQQSLEKGKNSKRNFPLFE